MSAYTCATISLNHISRYNVSEPNNFQTLCTKAFSAVYFHQCLAEWKRVFVNGTVHPCEKLLFCFKFSVNWSLVLENLKKHHKMVILNTLPNKEVVDT